MTKRFLALDYGTKRIGVAMNIGDLVEPLEVIENQLSSAEPVVGDDAIARIRSLCQTHAIETIVVGLSEGAMAERTQQFVSLIRQELALPVQLNDETLSSAQVQSRLREQGVNLSRLTTPIDHYAAALILEDFLAVN